MTESQEYDVFLSHSSKDKPAVERIADEVDQAFRNVFDLAGGFYK